MTTARRDARGTPSDRGSAVLSGRKRAVNAMRSVAVCQAGPPARVRPARSHRARRMRWWDERPVCAGAEARPWRAQRNAEESRAAFVRNACAKQDVYVLRGAWPADECEALAAAACACAEKLGGWTKARHASFATRDLPAHALPADVAEALHAAVRQRVLRPAAARRARTRHAAARERSLPISRCAGLTRVSQSWLRPHG